MDDVQQLGHALNFVYDDSPAPRRPPNEVAQPLRSRHELPSDVGLQEVDKQGVRERAVQPGRLPGAARPEQEEALARKLEESTLKFDFASQFRIAGSKMI